MLKAFIVHLPSAAMLVYSRALHRATRGLFRGEFFALSLFATLGMMVMISASHFLTLYLGLELMSLSLYSMVALSARFGHRHRGGHEVLRARRAGLGHAALRPVDDLRRHRHACRSREVAEPHRRQAARTRRCWSSALVFIVAGMGFKLGAVPFHMWVPDVYHGAPTAVTLLIGTAPEAGGVRVRAAHAGRRRSARRCCSHEWQQMLILLAVLSMAIGNITAIAQTNIKRMLAYSTISHMGFMLLGILSGDAQRLRRVACSTSWSTC